MRFLRVVAMTAVSFLSAYAANSVDINGFVQDYAKSPVSGASVSLVGEGLKTETDDKGAFALVKVAPEVSDSSLVADSTKKTQLLTRRLHTAGAYDVYAYRAFDLNGRAVSKNRMTRNVNRYLLKPVTGEQGNGSAVAYAGENRRVLLKETESFSDTLVVEKEGYLTQRIAVTSASQSVEVTLDTVPKAFFTKRGEGGSSQTVAQNSAIVDFNFAFENCDSVIVEGLPAGVTATVIVSKKSVNFTGTVTAKPGEYTYTMTTVGGYTTATKSGKFTVTEPVVVVTPVQTELVADGYASLNGGTTGGKGGDTVTVSTYADFKAAVQAKEAKVVVVKGTIRTTDGDGYGLKIASNKTIMGKDSSATIYGGISISGVKNVIVYNININGTYPNPGPSDGIDISNKSTNVWIHYVNIWNAEDGNLDIKGQANYITVSYVKFWYTDKNHPHRLNGLIGSGAANHPEDFGYLKVTYHHCWFSTLVNERMPCVMYGIAHVYNNYYNAPGNLYCVGVGSYASVYIENNYFKDVNNPINFMYNIYAYILQKNNIFDNTTGTKDGTASGVILGERYITTDPYTLKKDPEKITSLPYKYTLDNAKDVPAIVQREAGPHNLK